ncbi:hypothetical protein ABID14_001197 [Peptoniphilus olsenii]|uniref:DUF2922 domain-containing protein n=1 Tax=Peptoniphilus olsenii TaxID=411570 RepID=A0ABV2J9V0_9FIRM
MDTKKTVRLNFVDEEGNKKVISVSEPKADLSALDANNFGEFAVEKQLIKGKAGFLNKYNGATIVKRTEEELV